jgi:hypothetical protein
MANKQTNPGPVSAMRGAEVLGFSFRLTGAGTNPTNLRQGRANAIAAVTHSGVAGRFSVQLNKHFPRQLVACVTKLARAAGSATAVDARYVADSYNPTTGQFLIEVIVTGALANGAAGDEVHGWLSLQALNSEIEP